MLAYFAVNDAVGQLSARAAKMVEIRRPSFGNFFLTGKVRWFFGFAQSMSFPGLTMDANFISTISSDHYNKTADIVAYNSAQAARYSAYEHLIPEQMFNTDPSNPVEGASAVKALSRAAEQGQKIWTITHANLDLALSRIQVAKSFKDDIRQSVLAGRTATVSEKNVTIGSWNGVGYVLADNQTGAAAYKISGGANGGTVFLGALNGFGLAAMLGGLGFGAAPALMMVLGILLAASVIATLVALAITDGSIGCYYEGFGIGFGIYGIITPMLAHFGILGGVGDAASTGKLFANLMVPFLMDRILPNDQIWNCL
jgi:hypothetical protein